MCSALSSCPQWVASGQSPWNKGEAAEYRVMRYSTVDHVIEAWCGAHALTPARMGRMLGLSLAICTVAIVAACAPNLPNEQGVRQNFERHRPDYIRLASLIRVDKSAHFIDGEGDVDIARTSNSKRLVPAYRDLIQKIGVTEVIVREDGSIEFTLGGSGCAICSDSYTGVRYYPKDGNNGVRAGWTQTIVSSLDSAKLPHENGKVASGLYVVPIEPEWYLYRFEYQE